MLLMMAAKADGVRQTFDGLEITQSDQDQLTFALTTLAFLIWDSFPDLHVRRICEFISDLRLSQVEDISAEMDIGVALCRYLPAVRLGRRTFHKAIAVYDTGDSAFIRLFKKQICHLDDPDIRKKLYTVACFLSHLTLFDCQSQGQKAVDGWVETNDSLSGIEYDSDLIGRLRDRLRPLCDAYSNVERVGKFSAGAASTTLYGGRPSHCARGTGAAIKLSMVVDTCSTESSEIDVPWSHTDCSAEDSSIIQPVPKSLTKRRLIGMEPIALAFHQQAVAEGIRSALADVREFHYDPYSQEHNRDLVSRYSTSRSVGTIDLHAGSDYVTVDLVDRVFSGQLRTDLLQVRSDTAILPNGTRVVQRSYGGMGSATTFPTMSCLLCAVVLVSADEIGVVHPDYWVYGDDIIARGYDLVERVICNLKKLHFVINEEKTFHADELFKESCGVEYFDGTDISPTRLSRNVLYVNAWCHDASRQAEVYASAVDLANRLKAIGALKARRYVIRSLIERPFYELWIPSQTRRNSGHFERVTIMPRGITADSSEFGLVVDDLDRYDPLSHLSQDQWLAAVDWIFTHDKTWRDFQYRNASERGISWGLAAYDVGTYATGLDQESYDLWLYTWGRSTEARLEEDIIVPRSTDAFRRLPKTFHAFTLS